MQRLNADGSYTVETDQQSLWGTSATGAGGAQVNYVAPGTLDSNVNTGAASGTPGPNGQTIPPNAPANTTISNQIQQAFAGIATDAQSVLSSTWVKYAVAAIAVYIAYKIGHKVLKAI